MISEIYILFFKASLTIRHTTTVSQKKSGTSKKIQWDFQISRVGSLDFLDLKVNGSPDSNLKHYQQLTNANQKSIETVFSIAICRQCGDKLRSKTLFLTIFFSMFLDSIGILDCRLLGVNGKYLPIIDYLLILGCLNP